MTHRDAIMRSDDIVSLADMLRDMVKGPAVTDCHAFMQSIFKLPGSLKRTEIEQIRMRVSKTINDR